MSKKKFHVWYMNRNWFPRGILGAQPDPANLDATHVLLTEIVMANASGELTRTDDLEWIFNAMQGEVWSPNGEARELIIRKGLVHTSMSVGDVIVDEDDRTFIVADLGFAELVHKEV